MRGQARIKLTVILAGLFVLLAFAASAAIYVYDGESIGDTQQADPLADAHRDLGTSHENRLIPPLGKTGWNASST